MVEDEDVNEALGDYDISINNDFNNRKKGDKIKKARRLSQDHFISSPTIGPVVQHQAEEVVSSYACAIMGS